MRLNEFSGSTGYEIINCIDDDGYDRLRELDGSPQKQKWRSIRVHRVSATKRHRCRPSDAPWACSSNYLVFRRSAVDALRDILDAHGELLPLEDEGGVELYVYNARALDALDQKLSQGPRAENGRLEGATRPVFIPSIVEGVDIFQIKGARASAGDIYLSDRFLQRWKQAKLKGLDFFLAWDSDLPPEKQPKVWESKPIKL
jgi:hypothetical protein